MKNRKHVPLLLCVVFVITCCSAVWAQSSDDRNQFAAVTGMGSSVRWDVAGPHAAVTLVVSTPDGQVFSKEFAAGNAPEFRLVDANGERLPDGQYIYELRLTPIIAAEVKEKLKAAREKGNADEVQRALKKRGALPSRPQVQSGSFTVSSQAQPVKAGDPDVRRWMSQHLQHRRRRRLLRAERTSRSCGITRASWFSIRSFLTI
jgi:DNA-binding transcriptional regulator of glucitol operon